MDHNQRLPCIRTHQCVQASIHSQTQQSTKMKRICTNYNQPNRFVERSVLKWDFWMVLWIRCVCWTIIIEFVWNFGESSSNRSIDLFLCRSKYCLKYFIYYFTSFSVHRFSVDYTFLKQIFQAGRFFSFDCFHWQTMSLKTLHKENIAREIELKRHFTFIVTLLFLLSMTENWTFFMKLPGRWQWPELSMFLSLCLLGSQFGVCVCVPAQDIARKNQIIHKQKH